MAPRKRKPENAWMPKGVRLYRGRYVLVQYLGMKDGRRQYGKEIVLCGADAPRSEVWARYEQVTKGTKTVTIRDLLDEFNGSVQFRKLAPRTQKDYDRYYQIIVQKPMKGGVFGDVPAGAVTPGAVKRYLDKRADEGAPIAGNKEIGYLSAAYSWAVERDILKSNPCKDVKRNPKNKRQHYVEDADYQRALSLASPAYLPLFMELAYLCRLRKNEVLTLRWSAVKPEGLLVERGKGSKGSLITWTPRLRGVVDACKALPMDFTPMDYSDIPLIHDRRGAPITIGAIDSAWKRLMKKIDNPFWIHDLKRKAVSDFEGDKLKASGHRDPKMLEIYDVKVEEVEATR